MAVHKRLYWVPIRAVQTGMVRVEAFSGEEALQIVESGDINLNEAISLQVEEVGIIGAPIEEIEH